MERIRKLLELLGNPQKQLKFIHVAGTNGKGSTVAYISQILIESGYKTGQFTSPYIYEFAERIRINNEMISDDNLKQVTLKVRAVANEFAEDNHPTEFELMTAVAFVYFALKKCDIVVCEVGMGGRLDSTNVIEAPETVATVITTIDYDHMEFLGDTLKKIAAEKGAIIKPGVPVISAHQKSEVKKVFENKVKELGCKIYFLNLSDITIGKVDLSKEKLLRIFKYKNVNYVTKLIALYQTQNAAIAIETAKLIQNQFGQITDDSIAKGINTTQWPARFEIISRNPYVVLDGGHNIQGAQALIDSLKDVFKIKDFVFIMGVLADKDFQQMAELISPFAKRVYTVTPPNLRKLNAQDLANLFHEKNIDAFPVDLKDAINIAKENANADDVIVAFGSLYSISSLNN